MRSDDGKITAEIDDAVHDADVAADLRGAVCGVFLDDTAEVQAHARRAEPQVRSLPVDAVPAATCARALDRRCARHAARLQVPQPGQRAGGDVEAAAALRVQRRREVEQVGGFIVHYYTFAGVGAVADLRDQAVAAIMRIL